MSGQISAYIIVVDHGRAYATLDPIFAMVHL
jgi:hypothetical protein